VVFVPEYFDPKVQASAESIGLGMSPGMGHPTSTADLEEVRAAEFDAASERPWKKSRGPSYKPILIIHDLGLAAIVAMITARLVGQPIFFGLPLPQQSFLILLCMMAIFYFPNLFLYRYHQIYSFRFHLLHLVKAYCMGLLTFGVILAIYTWPMVIRPGWLSGILVLIAAGAVIVSRLFYHQLINLLMPLGLACIIIGLAGLIGSRQDPILLIHWRMILTGILVAGAIVAVSRIVLVQWVFNVLMRKSFRRQLLIIGSDAEAEQITNNIIRRNVPFWVVGTVGTCDVCELKTTVPKKKLGKIDDISRLIEDHQIDEVLITDEGISKSSLISLLDWFTSRGIPIWFLPRLMPIIGIKLYIDNLCGTPMIRLGANRSRWLFTKGKRIFDFSATLMGSIFTIPIFIAAAVAIKLISAGDVFFRTQAVGKHGRLFTMYKFRSMVADASKEIHKKYVTRLIKGDIRKDNTDRPLKITDDPRVTSVGRILRKTSLDELPQLINVLKGDMSLVGPRPCLTYEYEVYQDWHKKRTTVRPGITGLWQVVGRSEVEFDDMILLDLFYIYNRSWGMDLNILFETFFVVLNKKGAY
jgi:exopolysaccharide biosynthesis polyprenyl glycosylphosphotransferase